MVTGALSRIGMDVGVVRRILECGWSTAKVSDVGCCATVIYSFLCQCRDVTVSKTAPIDLTISLARGTADLVHRRGRKHRRPLKLEYAINPVWAPGTGPHVLLRRWLDIRPVSAGLFNLLAGKPLGAAYLGAAVAQALTFVSAVPPAGFCYASHSLRIGGLNEFVNLQH